MSCPFMAFSLPRKEVDCVKVDAVYVDVGSAKGASSSVSTVSD